MWNISLGVGSNMKENDVRISFLNQMPDSLAKGSLRDAWIAVLQCTSKKHSYVWPPEVVLHYFSSESPRTRTVEALGESDWVQAMTYEQEGKKVEK